MSILEQLIEVLCLAEELDPQALNESILNEKITTKKALRRKRRQQRKLAQQKAKEQAEQEENQETEEKQPKQEIIKYDPNPVEDTPQDYSENFKKFIQLFNALIQKYGPEFEKGMKIWQAQGNEKLCPQEAYDVLMNAINGLQQETQALLEQTLPQLQEGMHDQEIDYIQLQLTALNGFLEKKSQLIESIHPENVLEGEVEETPELETGADLLALPDNSKQDKKDDKKYKDVLYYEDWAKSNKDVDEIWKKIRDNEEEISKLGWGDFVKKNFHPVDWFGDRLWAIVTSPLAKDIVKAIMYCNPITAALFDGYIAGFGIKQGLENIEKWKAARKADKEKQRAKKPESFYNNRHIPKDISKLKLNELYNELHGNEDLVGWINASFNHPEVTTDDKYALRKGVRDFTKAFKNKKVDDARKAFNTIKDKVNEICDYMEWETYKDLQKAQMEATGNTEKEISKVAKKTNKERTQDKDKDSFKNSKLSKLSDEQIDKLLSMIDKAED